MHSWLLEKMLAGCPPEKLNELRQEIEDLFVEPIPGITSAGRMDQLESESFEKLLAQMGG